MASSKRYKDFILEQFRPLSITYKAMMGEFLLYYNDVLFDDRLLVRIVSENKKFSLPEVIPYKGAKKMFLVDCVDEKDELLKIVITTYNDLVKER